MLLALLALTLPAHSTCTLVALETRVDLGEAAASPLERRDRWTWRVGPGHVDCATLDFASPSTAPMRRSSVEIQRVDARDPRLDEDRWQRLAQVRDPGFGPSAGWRLHAPELRGGDLLVVEIVRDWPREDGGFVWRPGARGALEIATLDLPAALTVAGDLDLDLERDQDRQQAWLEGVVAGTPEPHADGPADQPTGTWTHAVVLLLPQRKPLRALGDDGRSHTAFVWRSTGGASFRVAPPADAVETFCEPCDTTGSAWQVEPAGGATWGWIRPGSWLAGEVVVPPGVAEATVSVFGPDADVVLTAAGGTAVAVDTGAPALDFDAAPADRGATLRTESPGPVSWRLRALDGVPVLPHRVAAEQLVARLAVAASIPEPGMGADLKGRKNDPSAVPEVLAALRVRMHPGSLPWQRDLAPRKLMKARRSGWGSPWELALVLARYLQQLKLDAVPMPARPAHLGPGDPASVEGWPEAVVRVRLAEQTVWIDPSCRSCAVGQLRPRLSQARVLSPGVERLPQLPPSQLSRTRTDTGLELHLAGPAAVELREQLLAVPSEERAARLAEEAGCPGWSLVEHEGLVEATGMVHLRFEAPGQGP